MKAPIVGSALALLLPAAMAASEPAAADPTTRNVVPVFNQLVLFTLPAPFKVAFEKTQGSFYVREHVPAGQTTDDWTRMITLTGSNSLASDPRATPQLYLQALTRGFQHHCPDSFSSEELGPVLRDYVSYARIVSCGHVDDATGKGHSESAIMLAIRGVRDFYTLQWVERGPESSHALPIDRSHWQGQLAQLQPIRLCARVPGETAPYPSCRSD